MNSLLGNLGIGLSLLGSVTALGASGAGLIRRGARWTLVGTWGAGLGAAGLGLSLVVLGAAFIGDDYSLAYVGARSDRSMALGLKIAALWSGQEGSLLLWSFLVSLAGALGIRATRHVTERSVHVSRGVAAVVTAFLGALLFSLANPFAVSEPAPANGIGLSPLLRHWAMIVHPPLLFAGYAATLVPFALALGSLAAGRGDDAWVSGLRRWVLGGWALLTAGMALGAWWAYVQLGWGGYWAWDPVENASLLPWLTGTALVHTMREHRRRGVMRAWTYLLAASTFLLCVLGTALTRGGMVESVHAFTGSSLGVPFMVLLGGGIAVTITAGLRWRSGLRDAAPVQRLFSREGFVQAANAVLVLMAATTLAGTLMPLIGDVLGRKGMGVGGAFYANAVVPLGLVAVLLMALGPSMPMDAEKADRRRLRWPAAGACVATGLAAALGARHPSALLCAGAAGFGLVGIAERLIGGVRNDMIGARVSLWAALAGQRKRMGGALAHAGCAVMVVGLAGSGLYSSVATATLRVGESLALGGRTLTLRAIEQVRADDSTAVECVITATDRAGVVQTLRAGQRFYDNHMESAAEAAVRVGWRADVYVALVGWERGGAVATIQARLNPLTAWIWAGAAGAVAGAAIGLLPARRVTVAVCAPATSARAGVRPAWGGC